MTETAIRRIIHSYALVFRYHFLDELIIQPNYLLTYTLDGNPGFFNGAMNWTVDSDHFEEELKRIEGYYKLRQKDPAIALETGTSSIGLDKKLLEHEYIRFPREDCSMWARESNYPATDITSETPIEFRVVKGFDDFQDYLATARKGWEDVLDYTVHAASLSKLYQHAHDGVKTFHIIGYVNNIPVCTSTLGVYFEWSHLINLSVIPEWRHLGVASQMISFASRLAATENSPNIYICIDANEKPGAALLTKNGFSQIITQTMYIKHET